MNKKELSEYFRKLGEKGGKKAAENMTKEQRRARAMKGVKARLKKKKGAK